MKKAITLILLTAFLDPGLIHAASAPSDQYFPMQWALHNDGTQVVEVDADDIHTIAQTGVAGVDIDWLDAQDEVSQQAKAPVLVGVIDSGIDPTHPDLQGRLSSEGWDFLSNTGKFSDKDGNGTDDMGHGTHVSGIIVAAQNNGIGIAGVAPSSVQVMPLRVLSVKYKGFTYYPNGTSKPGVLITDYAAQAINYAVAHHASVINMSLGWPKLADNQNVRQAVSQAVAAGVLLVVSAGNDHKDQPTYPCNYEGVLCVGAISNNGTMSIYSNTGGDVDLLAPGDDIISTYPLNVESQSLRIQGYEKLSGTSQATPQVAAIAAVLKSIHPQISINELKARLLVSAGALPSQGAALYGLVNLKRAIDAQPQPVFLPDFKGIDSVSVDPTTLQAQGQFSVKNLWAADEGVTAEVLVNGKSVGSVNAGSVASGASFSVPWTYRFSSLDESADLGFVVRVSDQSGYSRDFQLDVPAVRPMQTLAVQKKQAVPAPSTGTIQDWLGTVNGHPVSTLSPVSDYASNSGMPAYFRVVGSGSAGVAIQIFDPSASNPVTTVDVPNIEITNVPIRVIRMDANGDGKRDWLITGVGGSDLQKFFQFYFLDPSFQPLWGSSSIWQITSPQFLVGIASQDYSAPSTWVASGASSGARLWPCFFANGTLPDPDNFGALDPRHYTSLQHLYYLQPQAPSAGAAAGPVQLTIRALDNATFRRGIESLFQQVFLESPITQTLAEESAGHLRIFLGNGSGIDGQTLVWDIASIASSSTENMTGWDAIGVNGTPVSVISSNPASDLTAFLGIFDGEHGAITWASSEGQAEGRSDFEYISEANPFRGRALIGAFDLQSLGKYWFVETGFQLIAYHDSQVQTLPIDWDSSLPDSEFEQMFAPILVGTTANPLPGVYIDQTLVRGDRIAIATWNPSSGAFAKPLRYSLQLPDDCLQLDPVHLTSAPESFALPLLCKDGGQISYELVSP